MVRCDQRDKKPNFKGFAKSNMAVIIFIPEIFNANKNKGESNQHSRVTNQHTSFKIWIFAKHHHAHKHKGT